MMRFVELFAGIGGFRLGLENSGHTCVWANEILEKPRSIYKHNFGEEPDGRDVRTIEPSTVPEHDLLCGGFPCATFSIAGKRTGFSVEDTRGSLFFEICRFLRINKTKYFLLENVKGLINHDSGRTFEIILTSLDELGYDCQWQVCNSKNYGVPQNRERVFIVGNLRGVPRPKVFPIQETSGQNERKRQQKTGKRVSDKNNQTAGTLDAHYSKGGGTRTFVDEELLIDMYMRSHTMSNMKQRKQSRNSTWTLDTSPQNKMAIGTKSGVRKLTPIECERLQGLPDNFTKYYADGELVSDSERYERCGRTVTIPVVEAIGRGLHELYK